MIDRFTVGSTYRHNNPHATCDMTVVSIRTEGSLEVEMGIILSDRLNGRVMTAGSKGTSGIHVVSIKKSDYVNWTLYEKA